MKSAWIAVLWVFTLGSVAWAEPTLEKGLATPYPAPEFAGISAWIGSPPLTLKALRGKVVLVDFWAYSCINCIRTLPHLEEWDKAYRDKGLVIIGVHAPEFDFEKDIPNITAAARRYGIGYPVAADNDHTTWEQFHNHYWPAHYLIDQQGNVVYTHFGEGEYDVMDHNIRSLLGIKESGVAPENPAVSAAGTTPETYLGWARADAYSGTPVLSTAAIQHYTGAHNLPLHHWTLAGDWEIEGERIISRSSDSAITLHFSGKNIFAVMGATTGKPANITITMEGEKTPHGQVSVDGYKLYRLLSLPKAEENTFTIKPLSAGVAFYTFTFEQ